MAILTPELRKELLAAGVLGEPFRVVGAEARQAVVDALSTVAGVKRELAQLSEPGQVLLVLDSLDEDVLRGLVFEQLYRSTPEWWVNGWPSWSR